MGGGQIKRGRTDLSKARDLFMFFSLYFSNYPFDLFDLSVHLMLRSSKKQYLQLVFRSLADSTSALVCCTIAVYIPVSRDYMAAHLNKLKNCYTNGSPSLYDISLIW